MARTPSKSRWWRVSVCYRDRLIEDHRFDAGTPITVGQGGTSIVIPAIERGVLVDGDQLRAVPGLEPCADPDTFRVVDAPDVTVQVRQEEGERPAYGWGLHLPWRELAYGASAMGCLAALLLAHDVASAAPVGGPGVVTGRMERVLFSGEPSHPVALATFAAPESVDRSGPAVAGTSGPEPEPKSKPEPEPKPEPKPKPKSKSQSNSKPKPSLESMPTKRVEAKVVVSPAPSEGTHSHDAPGTPDAPAGRGSAVLAARPCDDPEADPKDNVDVVFVIDVSTTMGFALDTLADEITALDTRVRQYDPNRRYGLVLFVDDVLVTKGSPYADIELLRRDFARWSRFTSTNRQLRSAASNGDWPENGLDALHAAATRFDWRDADDTLRMVVYASDDDFGEAGDLQSGQRVHHDYATTVKALQSRSIRVASFTAPIGGACECEDVRGGFLAEYRGQTPIPVATGGAAFDIDEVAGGRLHFDRALSGLVENLVCSE